MKFLQSAKRTVLSAGTLALMTAGLMTVANPAFASQANPNTFVEKQPDGSKVTLRIKGDENFHWLEDTNGYTVIQNGSWYEYAKLDSTGKLVPSSLIVGRTDPKILGMQKQILPTLAERAKSALKIEGALVRNGVAPEGVTPPLGTVKNLVVMIRFADHTGRTLPSTSDINTLFNAVGGDPVLAPTGSVRDVYTENSYGQMTLVSTPTGWIDLPGTEASYAAGNSGLGSNIWPALTQALTILDATVNFNDYDANGDGFIDSITFIHSGYGAEWGGTDAYGGTSANRIWSHRWAMNQPTGWTSADGTKVYDYHISPGVWGTSGSAIGRIGVIAHETGHFFGLPDFYDTAAPGEGAGSYELMANSWGFDGSQRCPPHFSPYSKAFLGWYTPTVISSAGTYTLNQAETNAEAYKITTGFPSGEYLLVENRQDTGFDCSMPQGGLVIYHIDTNKADNKAEGYPGQTGWPTNNKHYRLAVLQADGLYGLEKGTNRGDAGDVYHGLGVDAIVPGPVGHPNTDTYQNGVIAQTGTSIFDISDSGPAMTFCLNSCAVNPNPELSIDNVTVSEGNTGTKMMAFTVTMSKVSATNVTFDFSTVNGTATAGSDFVGRTAVNKTIPAGSLTRVFNIEITGDTTVESNESFQVVLSNAVGADILDGTGVGTINNDDVPMLKKGVPVTGLSAATNGGLLYGFNVPAGKTGVTFTLSGGTGDADLHVKFGQYATRAVFDCRPYENGNEEVCTFSPGKPGVYYVYVDAYAAYTGVSLVADFSQIYMTVGDVSVTEGDSGTKVANFLVSLSDPSFTATTFDVASADGTATAGSDYVALASTGTIAAGSTSTTVSVTLNGDTDNEANEDFWIGVANVAGGAIASDAAGKGTIINDDMPMLSISDAVVTEGNAATKVLNFTVTMSKTSTSPVSFKFSTADGSATSGTDYVARTAVTKSIPAGQTSIVVGVVINGDMDVEASETLYVNLANVVGGGIDDGQGLGTIVDND